MSKSNHAATRAWLEQVVLNYLRENGPRTASQLFDALKDGPRGQWLETGTVSNVLRSMRGRGLVTSTEEKYKEKVWSVVE